MPPCHNIITAPSQVDAMSKIIAITSQKGGAGKTTLALALAGEAVAAGKCTVLIDLDPQASAAVWSDGRGSEAPIVEAVPYTRLGKALDEARQIADLIILDTAPHAEAPALAACRAADIILIPCRPNFLDVMAIQTTVDMVGMAGKRPVIVFGQVRPNASRATADATAALAGAAVDICPHVISSRADFADATTVRQTVREHAPSSKAAGEADAIAKWVFARLGL